MDDAAPTLWDRVQLLVAAPLVVAASLGIVLSAPEKEVPPVKGGHPGSFTAPASWLGTDPVEVERAPDATGAQEVVVTVVVKQQVDGMWKPFDSAAESGAITPDAAAISLDLPQLEKLPSGGVFEIGAVVEWFSGSERLGWTSAGLADPSTVIE